MAAADNPNTALIGLGTCTFLLELLTVLAFAETKVVPLVALVAPFYTLSVRNGLLVRDVAPKG